MKYTRLPEDELQELEKEFIDFLVVNGITADDWVAIKRNEPLNADEIINQFSDVVWESILRSTNYLKKIEDKTAYFFKCNTDSIELKKIDSSGSVVEQHNATKEYNMKRELELFEMISNGCVICNGEEFKELG